jgi:hydrogenase expression/formation protein HypD
MKLIEEFRNVDAVKRLAELIDGITTQSWTIMEVCGGQTHAILRFGIDKMLPGEINLLHGPGCPVCVTPVELIDKAIILASREDVIFCSFGDMLRVPGSQMDLLSVKAVGGDVRICYSPMDALKIAQENPSREVVFFAVGFETTAPANGMAVYQAEKLNLRNFSILCAQVLIPPAIELLFKSGLNIIDGLLAPGHVCTVSGYEIYEKISAECKIPISVTGFEPVDLLNGIYMTIEMLEKGRHGVINAYDRVVKRQGNPGALTLMGKVFEKVNRNWRGLGMIPQSGLALRNTYACFDAERKFDLPGIDAEESSECISGLILQGRKKPTECEAFGTRCTPGKPMGPTMVSSEGACAAYYRYKHD